jgi:type I restriction enzyme M protein
MPFNNFTNPYQNAENAPKHYRKHSSLSKLFKADGNYVRPAEDPVTLWAIDLLHQEYGIPLDALELETSADFSEGTHQGGRRYQGRADLIVYDDRYIGAGGGLDIAFIMVEAMEPGKKFEGTEAEGWVEHLKRLNAYMSASPSARYAVLTSGNHTKIYRRDLEYPRTLQEIGDLPKYESARSAAEHSPFKVILNPSEPDGVQTGLQPLTRDKFREVLGDTRSGCHSILRDNEGLQPQEAVDAMVKFLFAKWYDEQATIDLVKKTGEMRSYVFSYKQGETDPERLMVQMRDTFEKAKQWERDTLSDKFGDNLGIRLAFTESDALEFKPHTTQLIVERLQPWSLRKSTADVKGGVFEDFLGKTFRDDLGQYFTPTPVINLMVGILQPTVNDFVGDPACGSARMLTHVLDYVRKGEFAKAEARGGAVTDLDEPSQEFLEFRENRLFGAEISRNVMHVARVNCLMNGAQYVDLKAMDALQPLSSITGGIMEGLPEQPGFYPGGLTMILTNPPFGLKVTSEAILKDLASRDGITNKKGKLIGSISQEIAFINRCLEFLKPGGKLAIVLPDSVLANSSTQDVREWILRWARLKAVISLPQTTFSPYGAGVKASIIVLEKRNEIVTALGQIDVGQQVISDEEDYEVYMAQVNDIGYDANGRLTVTEDESHEPLQVREAILDFVKHSGK